MSLVSECGDHAIAYKFLEKFQDLDGKYRCSCESSVLIHKFFEHFLKNMKTLINSTKIQVCTLFMNHNECVEAHTHLTKDKEIAEINNLLDRFYELDKHAHVLDQQVGCAEVQQYCANIQQWHNQLQKLFNDCNDKYSKCAFTNPVALKSIGNFSGKMQEKFHKSMDWVLDNQKTCLAQVRSSDGRVIHYKDCGIRKGCKGESGGCLSSNHMFHGQSCMDGNLPLKQIDQNNPFIDLNPEEIRGNLNQCFIQSKEAERTNVFTTTSDVMLILLKAWEQSTPTIHAALTSFASLAVPVSCCVDIDLFENCRFALWQMYTEMCSIGDRSISTEEQQKVICDFPTKSIQQKYSTMLNLSQAVYNNFAILRKQHESIVSLFKELDPQNGALHVKVIEMLICFAAVVRGILNDPNGAHDAVRDLGSDNTEIRGCKLELLEDERLNMNYADNNPEQGCNEALQFFHRLIKHFKIQVVPGNNSVADNNSDQQMVGQYKQVLSDVASLDFIRLEKKPGRIQMYCANNGASKLHNMGWLGALLLLGIGIIGLAVVYIDTQRGLVLLNKFKAQCDKTNFTGIQSTCRKAPTLAR